MGVSSPLALALPLVLLGLGHGLLVPPALSGTVGVVPALAGAAAAGAGVMQQLMGAVGGYTVGLVDHQQGAASLGVVMLVYALGASLALAGLLWRPRQNPTRV
jgi:DHA1 family bicyclomycin/chloramphenicol resistance-like MFS transporter